MTNYDPSKPPPISRASPPAAPAADHPLSPRGRFARLAYLAWYLMITMIFSIAAILGIAIFGHSASTTDPYANIGIVSILMMALAYIVFFYYAIVFTIRRLHDLNQSGWLALLILVPLVNMFFMLYVMIAPGTKGSNNFGLPRPNKGWETILGIMYIILSVLAIIAAIVVMTMLGGMSADMSNLANMTNY